MDLAFSPTHILISKLFQKTTDSGVIPTMTHCSLVPWYMVP